MPIKPIPLLFVTGFLGSGKTTLINGFLNISPSLQLAVIVNEFGEIGIDGKLLKAGDIIEMSGGCICCTTGEEVFESAVQLIKKGNVNFILIETSGIAKPSVLLQQFESLPNELKQYFDLRGILCTIDPLFFHNQVSRQESQDQIKTATHFLFTKTDVTNLKKIEETEQLLKSLLHSFSEKSNPLSAVKTSLASFSPNLSTVNLRSLFEWCVQKNEGLLIEKRSQHFDGEAIHHQHLVQLQTFAFSSNAPLRKSAFYQFLSSIQENSQNDKQPNRMHLLRAKGWIQFAEEEGHPFYIFHWVDGIFELSLPPLEKQIFQETQLVFIGENLNDHWLQTQLQRCSLYQ